MFCSAFLQRSAKTEKPYELGFVGKSSLVAITVVGVHLLEITIQSTGTYGIKQSGLPIFMFISRETKFLTNEYYYYNA